MTLAPLGLILVGLFLPSVGSAQGVGVMLRAGAGLDREGPVVGGQVEFVDFGRSSSVEVALAVFEARLIEAHQGTTTGPFGSALHDYHEETRVRGAGLIASLLLGQGPRDSRGPYLAVGLGLGLLDVGWQVESPTDVQLGTPRAGGGSLRKEDGPMLGGLGSVGLGLRVHPRLDVRAQALTLMAPPTDTRRDVKLLATFMLTAAIGI
jgi:hypothetical protein